MSYEDRMRIRILFILVILMYVIQGCRFLPATPSHQFIKDKAINPDQYMRYWDFVDVSQDEIAELLVIENYKNNCQPFMVKNQNTDNFSQITLAHPLMSFKVIYNEFDDSNWLFYSFNDGRKVYLQATKYIWEKKLKRETYYFQTIDRTDSLINNPNYQWVGNITPVLIKDIDDDNEVEVVCLAADAFRSNPRGIYVYNLLSGKLKWKLDTAANISSLIYEDCDLDGKKDLIASTMAFKNNQSTINGTSDYSPVIFACNTKGEMIYIERCFDGYGQVLLESNDIDNDGNNEIIRVDHTWGTDNYKNSVSIIESNRKRFVSKKRYVLESSLSREFKLLISDLDESNEKYIFLNDKKNGLFILNKDLQLVKHAPNFSVMRVESIEDINNDNDKEILLFGGNNEFVILDNSLGIQARIKNPFPDDEDTQAAVIPNGIEKPKRIAIACHTGIIYYNYTLLPWYVLLWHWVDSLLPVFSGLMLIALILLGIKSAKQRNRESLYLGQTQTGVMIISKHQIIKINQAMLSMLCENQENKKIDLSWISNKHKSLYKEIMAFCHSKAISTTKDVYIESDTVHTISVFMHRLCYVPCRIMIMLSAQVQVYDGNADKIQWAEISRRLSHHVRRHISNILLALNILEKNSDPAEQTAKREMIKIEVDRIKRFTQAFQRFTEMGEYQLKQIDIVPWLENSINRFHVPANIEVIKDWSLASLPTLIEPIRFEEVMINILTNAIESMPDGGTLRISLSACSDKNVLIEIEDSGVGIPEKYLTDIWKPFFTTKQSGTGIGLPEVKKILNSMQGEIELISEEGIGTTVSILLKGESL